MLDQHGQVAFVIATGIDVTVQRVAETAIRESESRYRQIVEGSLGLVCTHDMQGKILSINEHGAEALGYRCRRCWAGRCRTSRSRSGAACSRRTLTSCAQRARRRGCCICATHAATSAPLRIAIVWSRRSMASAMCSASASTSRTRFAPKRELNTLSRQSNSVLESVGDGIFALDLDGRITLVNPAAAQMLGYKQEEILGRHMHELIHHTRADGSPYSKEDSPIQASLRHLSTVRVANEVFWRKDGTSFAVEYVARPQIETVDPDDEAGLDSGPRQPAWRGRTAAQVALTEAELAALGGDAMELSKDAHGHAVGVVVAFTDISERNALDRMKDEFISTVSHELRTPLTSLRAALGLLSGGALNARPEKMRQMMEIAIGNTDRLVRLVNDILDLERIGSGKAELHFAQTSVDDLFKRATTKHQAAAQRGNIRFAMEANNVMVWADPERIVQTLDNLLSNAIKFSPQASTIPSEIRLAAHYVTPDEALIEIEDHGRGIPADKLQQIFERFKQVESSDSRTMGGTGLGLAICRSIVQQHGGHIWATSTVGEGSTFHFTLPTKPSSHLG